MTCTASGPGTGVTVTAGNGGFLSTRKRPKKEARNGVLENDGFSIYIFLYFQRATVYFQILC